LNQINTNWLVCGKASFLTANILRLRRLLPTIRFLARPVLHAFVILTCSMIGSAWASGGYVYDAVGEVSLGIGKFSTRTIAKNDVIPSDAVVNTGDKSYAVLKFEDGQIAAMQANTAFHVREYRYEPKNPDKSNIVFSKFTGAMRFVTGLIGQRNHHAFRLATPNATIGIQGTDFLVATLNNTLYGRILSGSISMTNEAGSVEFTAGQTILMASSHTLPVSIPASSLPAGVFSQLDAIPIPPTVPLPIGGLTPPVVSGVGSIGGLAIPVEVAVPLTAPIASSSLLNVATSTKKVEPYIIDTLCDFCTRRSPAVPTHVTAPADTAAGSPVTGEKTLFGLHNLTPTGANTGEICAFCHTPQGAENNAVSPPLWNRTAAPVSSYRAYSSLGSAAAEATGSVSLSCLSCHDGSQAPNVVINTPNNNLDIPEGEVISTGNTLKNHHPVGMPYAGGGQNQNAPEVPLDPIPAYTNLVGFNSYATNGNKFTFFNRRGIYNSYDRAAFNDIRTFSKAGVFKKEDFNKTTYSGSGNSTVWWIDTPNSKKGRQKSDLYLFTRTDTIDSIPSESTINQPYVECATCHDPHSTNPTFLRLPGGNARSQICLTCHNK
jgi:predicted CXXCH cytochrome family protein